MDTTDGTTNKQGTKPAASDYGNGANAHTRQIGRLFIVAIALGVLFAAVALSQFGTWQSVCTALLWALACFAISALAGFLFGIPKVLQSTTGAPAKAPSIENEPPPNGTYQSLVNTNLGEISDWLTKIIVGLGLINLKEIPEMVLSAARILASGLGSVATTGSFLSYSVALLVAFVSMGFLFGYLSTRLYLAIAFRRADMDGQTTQRNADSGVVDSLKLAFSTLSSKLNQLIKDLRNGDEEEGATGSEPGPTESEPPPTPPGGDVPELVSDAAPSTTVTPVDGRFRRFRFSQRSADSSATEEELLKLAAEYNNFRSPRYEERVHFRNTVLDKMAAIISTVPNGRTWVWQQAVKTKDVGLIAGYATVVISEPLVDDCERLFNMDLNVPFKHARYRITAAIGCLFDQRFAGLHEVPIARSILNYYFNDEPDEALRQRLLQTAAQIQSALGKPFKLGSS